MKDIENKIKKIEATYLQEVKKAKTIEALEAIRIAYLGRKGTVAELMGQLSELSLEQKRIIGPLLNQCKQTLQQIYETRHQELSATTKHTGHLFDVTAYKPNQPKGSIHIYTQLIDTLSEIFISMGYTIADGPEVETEYYN